MTNKEKVERRKILWQERREKGLCPACGKVVTDGFVKCWDCRRKYAAIMYRHNHKNDNIEGKK